MSESAFPDGITDAHLRESRSWRRHASPLPVVVLGAIVVVALAGLLGHERDWTATGSGTTLAVHLPETIRNGEFLEVRIAIERDTDISELVIGIDQALWEDITINTMIPAASDETSRDGEFLFTFGQLDPSTTFLLKVDAQVNPDIVGGNAGTIKVYDGEEPIVEQDVEMMVLP
jgi:hypothetical protein